MDEERVLYPAGPCLFLVNLNTGEKEKVINENQSAVFSLISNKKFVYSIGFGGDVIILDRETLKVVDQLQVVGEEIRHCSCNEEYISITSECQRQIHQVFGS